MDSRTYPEQQPYYVAVRWMACTETLLLVGTFVFSIFVTTPAILKTIFGLIPCVVGLAGGFKRKYAMPTT
jgi:hypothetical protein